MLGQRLRSFHLQAMIQSLKVMGKKPFATTMVILVIAIALALPTFFLVFTNNLSQFFKSWQRVGHISIYLKPAVNSASQKTLLEAVKNTQGVGQATLKTPEEGLAELMQQEGMQDMMRYLPENPLPAVIEVIPAVIMDSPSKLELLAQQLKILPNVDQVKLDMEWLTRLNAILDIAGRAGNVLMAVLCFAIILIIGTTLRLTIHHRQEEIQVLKLIGANSQFILRPFLYSGIVYGFAGAIGAIFIVNILILSFGALVNQLAFVYQIHFPINVLSIRQILLLLSIAGILGWFAALLSVKRQLSS